LFEHFHLQYTTKFVKNLPIIKRKNRKKKSAQDGRQMVEVKFKFLHNILHYYNNIFAFRMHMFTISILSFNKLNTTIHSNIKFMVITYN